MPGSRTVLMMHTVVDLRNGELDDPLSRFVLLVAS
jgi:hypothetical protein